LPLVLLDVKEERTEGAKLVTMKSGWGYTARGRMQGEEREK
jgi:hypothetical protein